MTGSSFAFINRSKPRYSEDADGMMFFRHIESVQTFDVGPVTYEAYTATAAGFRSRRSGPGILEHRNAQAELEAVADELTEYLHDHYHAPQRRQRMLALADLPVLSL